MEPEFWHQRWAAGQIGFHQRKVNPYLIRHWPELHLAPGSAVLVPLCGKSHDLRWLAEQGHAVMGVELSRDAVAAFFAEQGLIPDVSQAGAFEVWRSGRITVWCGDFFALTANDTQHCTALYDRAALIALPPAMRLRYQAHLARLLVQGAGLIVTLDYPQAQLPGPPFAVAEDEVRDGFPAWRVEVVQREDILAQSPKFIEAGVDRLEECVYRVLW